LLSRFLARELPGLEQELEVQADELAARPPEEQVVHFLWLDLRHQVRELRLLDEGRQLVELLQARCHNYLPDRLPDSPATATGWAVAAAVAGTAADDVARGFPFYNDFAAVTGKDTADDRFRLDTFLAACRTILPLLERDRGRYDEDLIARFAMIATELVGYQAVLQIDIQRLGVCAHTWQKLWWATESLLKGGALYTPGRVEPFPGDPVERLAYLARLAAQQPILAEWPALARFVPASSDELQPLSTVAYERFLKGAVAYDAELSQQLAEALQQERRYALDHIAVVEIDEMDVRRLVLAPERRSRMADTTFLECGFWFEHATGAFVGKVMLVEGTDEIVTFAPSVANQAMRRGEDWREAQAVIELVVLAAWRDLVVADVREQQYESTLVRKQKGKSSRPGRTEARGDYTIIRYLPRRVVARRAEEKAAEQSGQRAHPRLYPVGAFARALPQGRKRGGEAEQFAAEIGIPLADYQTVVKPHYRGGSEDERRAALESAATAVRHWKSWSAVDLLRTRTRRS
jgi:hypothetical protein